MSGPPVSPACLFFLKRQVRPRDALLVHPHAFQHAQLGLAYCAVAWWGGARFLGSAFHGAGEICL